ncbi:hypothetical protein DSS72_12910 [Salmonella enterica subsp. enterica serovar Agona]|uniref:Uncharacterized protein n=1 Tax=Salmonella enterica TaxID=28901 RepID=A0A5Y5BLM6_SALER|nr:hypothetical protein [Salmonella enterica]EBX7981950.1 hypothetical protein [Salmonella enterica subsp. enterica serovar Agona]EBX9499018.1 hypothetical protein [Salmonella enterica subsp. enterica serovar Typhimurium]ECN9521099.1 hypothetical protein [Salmonella enterica subsp. enterica serovar Newport]ECY4912289.1 hypothetical protein [Salmonella enterica subsp. enterica serovar Oranienburg]
MKISTERAEVALKHCKRMRLQINPAYSDAGDWWDNLTPEWRGVVLHAAAVTSGSGVFKAHLSKFCWRELYERLGYRDMIQLRRGISRARLTFEGFGSLRDSDFSKRTANRPIKKVNQINTRNKVQMIIAPHIVHKLQQGNH